jgi:hypothetical protein
MCVNGKMRLAETVPGMVAKRVKENGGGLNSSMMYLIYCECHNILPPSTTI